MKAEIKLGCTIYLPMDNLIVPDDLTPREYGVTRLRNVLTEAGMDCQIWQAEYCKGYSDRD